MSSLIDWELLAQLQTSPQIRKAEPWNAFAKRYDGYSRLQRMHTRAQIDYMRLQAHETLLDVGAGTGRISVPAAQQLHEVTALDVADGMLALLSQRAKEEGVHNIRTLQLDWADVQPGTNVPLHDVVIASRSPATIDLHKLDAMATRAVYIMLFHGPSLKQFHDTLVAGIDHFPSMGPQRSAIQAQALLFNRLVEMGIDARVDYLEDGFYAQFGSEDEAVAHFEWLDLPAGSQARLRANLRPFYTPCEGGVELLARTCTVVVWWDKSPITMDFLEPMYDARWLLVVGLALALPLQAQPSAAPKPALADPTLTVLADGQRLVVYDQGQRQVQVPAEISRVATVWEAQNSALALLGFGPHIVATTRYAREMPAMRQLIPGFEQVAIASAGGGDLNMEELLRLKPQVLFTATHLAPAQEQQLRNAGIAVASFRANSLSALRERMDVTAQILGPQAQQRAQQYRAYFDGNIRRVEQALADVRPAQRVSVYHAVGQPLSTSGRPSLNQDWMDLAHVRNVAEHWFEGGAASASMSIEQLLQADPDIIVAMRASDAESIRTDPRWRRLTAVKNQRVYANPRGMFWWGRETPEVALQFLWLAKLAYPEAMQHIDMRAETRAFYQTFYGYTLSDTELSDFLQPQSP